MKIAVLLLLLFSCINIRAQRSALYENLPIGKYAVGFKIMTFTDEARVSKPLYNYFGEKETGDRTWKITVHLWYPAKPNTGQGVLTYGDHCYNQLLSSTNEPLAEDKKTAQVNSMRQNFQGFYGPVTDADWQKLAATPLIAQKEAEPLPEKFPLLVGMLRALSTTVTNELLASNGYVVAMVVNSGGTIPLVYTSNLTDMQQTMARLNRMGMTDPERAGTFGFSGAGFAQVLLAMNDPRIQAVADIESAIYGENNLFKLFSASDYYNVSQLKVPFLHIYGKDLAKTDEGFQDFYKKKYSHRYHLLLNQPGLHHWDVATEGRASTTVLHLRGPKEPAIRATYELTNWYLLHFFNSSLKKSEASQKIMNEGRSPGGYADSLWTLRQYPALPFPPDRNQFTQIVEKNGITEAVKLAKKFYAADSAVDFLHQNNLNLLARQFYTQNRPTEGLALMQLAVELHPAEAWLWNNLADMQDNLGNKQEAIRSSEMVLQLLKDYKGSPQSFNGRILQSSTARLNRLKKEN